MESTAPSEALDASFDLVARQDATEAAVESLRGDVADVKARLDRVSRAAARPVIEGAAAALASLEVKGFVDGYLRMGRETEIKSLSGTVLADGGYAVPREVDALISALLRLGERDRSPRRNHHPASPRSPRPPAKSTPTRRRARPCSTIPPSTSNRGWRTRSPWNSPARKAPPS
jgi:hypothetical protein